MQLSILPNAEMERGQARLESLRHHAKDPAQERARLASAAKDFEQIMVEFMVKAMRKNVPESPLFPHNNGLQIFKEMLDTQYAKMIADKGGLGLARMMVQQLENK